MSTTMPNDELSDNESVCVVVAVLLVIAMCLSFLLWDPGNDPPLRTECENCTLLESSEP